MTKAEYINALSLLIDQAKKEENFPLVSILYTVTASIVDDSLKELSNYTYAFSMEQINKYKAQQN